MRKTVREQVHDGQTGELREMAYTSCKIVGSGSFGIVFQTKLIDTNEDAAIKRVLQDKRFKVGRPCMMCLTIESRATNHASSQASEHRRSQSLFLL